MALPGWFENQKMTPIQMSKGIQRKMGHQRWVVNEIIMPYAEPLGMMRTLPAVMFSV